MKPTQEPQMPPQWSYSRFTTYEQCPLKAKLRYIDWYRDDGPGGAAANRGTEIHKLAEDWLRAKRTGPIPPIFEHFRETLLKLRRLQAVPELAIGLKRDWSLCAFDAPDYWWHGELDALAMLTPRSAWIVDWKSGKVYPEHVMQLELYALVAFLADPYLDSVQVDDAYVDQKKMIGNLYLRRQVPTLQAIWERRTTPMFNDRAFAPCPNFLCKYCEFRKELGSGLCQY